MREWLNSQVAGGCVDYHPASQTYELTPEQATVLADEPKTLGAFRSGRGVSWGEHDQRLFCGIAAFYRNAYIASLVTDWLPALTGVTEKLAAGAKVADVGCGHGHSTVLIGQGVSQEPVLGLRCA